MRGWLFAIALLGCGGGSRAVAPVEQPPIVEAEPALEADFTAPASRPVGEPITVPLFADAFERTREQTRRVVVDGVEQEKHVEVRREKLQVGRFEVTFEGVEGMSGTYLLVD